MREETKSELIENLGGLFMTAIIAVLLYVFAWAIDADVDALIRVAFGAVLADRCRIFIKDNR